MRKFIPNIVWGKTFFLFHFSLSAFSVYAKKFLARIPCHTFPLATFFHCRTRSNFTLCAENSTASQNNFPISAFNFKLKWLSIYISCEFNDLPERKFCTTKIFIFYFWHFSCCEVKYKWEREKNEIWTVARCECCSSCEGKMKICIHASIISLLSEELLFHTHIRCWMCCVCDDFYGFWHIMRIVDGDNEMKSLGEREKFCRHDNVLGFHDFSFVPNPTSVSIKLSSLGS